MEQQRGQRQGVENLWVSRLGQRTKLYGKGKQYRARYVDTSGKEHTKRFRYKADANDWLKQITRSGVDIAPPKSGEWTVAQQFSQWVRKADIAETTRATRNHTWRAHVSEKWGELQVAKVAPPDVKSWVADMASAGIGVPTIENALGVLRMVLGDAVDDGRLIRNPCIGINAPRRQHKSRAYLNHRQVDQLATAAGKTTAWWSSSWPIRACGGVSWRRSRLGRWTCFVVACRSHKRLRRRMAAWNGSHQRTMNVVLCPSLLSWRTNSASDDRQRARGSALLSVQGRPAAGVHLETTRVQPCPRLVEGLSKGDTTRSETHSGQPGCAGGRQCFGASSDAGP